MHIAMEYIEHGDLGKYIADYPVKARSETKEIASQILEGLVVLHEREICHRDLKPQVCTRLSFLPPNLHAINLLTSARMSLWRRCHHSGSRSLTSASRNIGEAPSFGPSVELSSTRPLSCLVCCPDT